MYTCVLHLFVLIIISGLISTETPPNIVLMIADDLGIGDIGCFGNTTLRTPHIDSIATRGIKFTHHLAAASVCTPSRAAFLTGRYPIRMGMVPTGLTRVNIFVSSISGLPRNEVTIADLAKQKGYRTALIGKWHLGLHSTESGDFGFHPVNRGFDYFYGLPLTNLKDFGDDNDMVIEHQIPHFTVVCLTGALISCLTVYYLHNKGYLGNKVTIVLMISLLLFAGGEWLLWTNLKLLNSILMRNKEVIEQPIRLSGLTDRLVREGVQFLEQRSADKQPFLLLMSWVQVHTALHATHFKGKSAHGPYGDEVEEMDWSVGQILDALDSLRMTNNTLLYFTSDNGGHVEEMGVHGNREGGYNGIYRGGKMQGGMDGGIRVPTVAMWPGVIKPNSVIDTPSSQMDIFPTLAQVLNAELPSNRVIDGQNMLREWQGQKSTDERFLFHYCGAEIHSARFIPNKAKQDVWKLLYATPNWVPGTEGCGFHCRCGAVTWHDPPLLYNIGHDHNEQQLCTQSAPCEPAKTAAEHNNIIDLINKAVQDHKEGVDMSVESQYAIYRMFPRPWLQPCCNFPSCDCEEGQ